jgi:alkanesulfonate monooxygenase SsuD/methylene tetrahydromethanopterin reductase-like flavin-dependent oxidoreductase (luciferase family)
MDDANSVVDAVLIRSGRVVATGEAARSATDVPQIDLDGRVAMPGLVDGHPHLLHLATRQSGYVDLGDAVDFDDVVERFRARASTVPPGEWLVGTPIGAPYYFVERWYTDLAERTMPALERGFATAGRDRKDFEIILEVICAVGQTDEEIAAAANGVKTLLGFYGSTPSYKPVLDVEGWGELQPELNALSKQGDWAGMAKKIDDDVLRTIAVVGTPKEVAAEIVRRFGHEANRVCLYFPGYPISDGCIAETIREIKVASGEA